MRTSTCRRRRQAQRLRSRSWRGPAPCSKSRRLRCCLRRAPRLPRRNPRCAADLQRRAEKSENSSPIMGKTPAGRRRAGAMRIPWWAWAWPAAAWLVLLLTPFLQIRGFVAAIAGAALIATVFAAVYHAEVVAHRTGEPFGTLVLAVAVTVIEVALIVSVMVAAPAEKAGLARDTVFAAVMIVCNGIVGACLLWGGVRHHEQGFQVHGASAALAILAALTILTLILPNVATTAPGPYFSTSQLIFAGLVSLLLYGSFVFVQTMLHRDYFLPVYSTDEEAHAAAPSNSTALVSAG